MKKRGFTIIELLVIISIIGLISSVALANLQGSRGKAKIAAAQIFRGNINSVLGADTAAAWNFNEGTVGAPVSTIQDSSGSGISGTVIIPSGGAATYVDGVTSNSTGVLLTGGASINGTGISSGGSNPTTVTAWIKPINSANVSSIFNLGVDSCNSYTVGIESTNLMVGNSTGSVSGAITAMGNYKNLLAAAESVPPIGATADEQSTIKIANNRWQFIAASFDSSGNVQTYIDGVSILRISGLPTSECQPVNLAVWSIGGLAPGNGPQYTYYSGSVDDVTIYNGSLSPALISVIYKKGLAKHSIAVN